MVTYRYLRARLLLALGLTVAASIFGWYVDRARLSQAQSKSELSEAFSGSLHTMTDALIALHAVRSATTRSIGDVSKDSLATFAAELDETLVEIETAAHSALLAPGTRSLLETDTLDPLGLIDGFASILNAISRDPDLWGRAAERHVAAASAITSELLPVVRRISQIEIDHLAEVLARHQQWRMINLGLVVVLALAIWGVIFRPMEREIMRTQAEARRRMEQAHAASRAKSDFLATMSHEIRTPMNGVLGLTEQLGLTRLEPAQRDLVEELRSSGAALMTVIEDVLDISSIEAGKLKLDPRSVQLREELKSVQSIFRYEAQRRGLSLRFEIDDALAGHHVVDAGRLRQILVNLIGNALKFTEKGEVALRLYAREVPGARQELSFEVTDTGIGIAADHLDRIFSAFEQVDTSATRRFGGTGLGLTISKRIAEALGGELTVRSEPGRGSTFLLRLSLPLGEAATAGAEGGHEAAPDVVGTRVLAAEDNRVNRKILASILQRAGCETIFAEDGEEAVRRAVADAFDIVLMDLSMPGMDGFAATRAIEADAARRGRQAPPIIALTAHVGDSHRDRCLGVGMKAMLGKPFRSVEIIRAISEHAERSHPRPSKIEHKVRDPA